ncbi:MAG: exodeoxyribonuclease III [Myxococcales bacterium]|nr:exodeoxyribonuclease III [Myxococcales bacterium]MCB9526362.1 exodeoxyribonuclease III [Myxococcales bacterium]
MKIVTWNVNSVKARFDRVLNWVDANQPDVLCLQELKTEGDAFPFDELGDLGYEAEILGQKTYNGVALISREPLEDVVLNMGDGVDDPQARLIAATTGGVRVVCVYVPNGGQLNSAKYPYKLEWYARLRRWFDAHEDPSRPTVLCGDFNVAPKALDIEQPGNWEGGVLANDVVRAALQGVVDWGFVDTFRHLHPQAAEYSWWDYRRRGLAGRDGMRIDMVYATRDLAAVCTAAGIDREERRETPGWTKPSDHAPCWAEFDL